MARRFSGESDFGVWWTDPGMAWPKHRVSVVHNTGELYVMRLGGGGVTIHGDSTVVSAGTDQGRLWVPAVFEGIDEAERVLDGWAEACGMGGLHWLYQRLGASVSHEGTA